MVRRLAASAWTLSPGIVDITIFSWPYKGLHFVYQPQNNSLFLDTSPGATMDASLAEIRENVIASSSRRAYKHSTVRFLKWVVEERSFLITDDFMTILNAQPQETPLKTRIDAVLQVRPQVSPIHFDQLTPTDFIEWLRTLEKTDGSRPSCASYRSHRSALFNLYRTHNQVQQPDFEAEMALLFRGMERLAGEAMAQGDLRCKEGKDPIPFSLYCYFGREMLRDSSRELIFGRTFFILGWNLMARASNTLAIRYEHMEFVEDSLCIYFAQTKTDQFGGTVKDARHVYANPLMPEICPLLALGIMWLTYGFDDGNNHLFIGRRQYERFRKLFDRVLESSNVELEQRGINKKDLGSHSIRKGSSSYCSSGSTACPSVAAIDIRAGWTQGGVKKRYVKHEHAGDMFVGRTVAGLPINSPEFAILPPQFDDSSALVVRDAIQLCFPGVPHSIVRVVEYALASLIYHSEFLISNLPPTHPVFGTKLFTSVGIRDSLVNLVKCNLPDVNSRLQATGIPPHVVIMQQLNALKARFDESIKHQSEHVAQVVEGVERVIVEHSAMVTETVTRDGLRRELEQHSAHILTMLRGDGGTTEPESITDDNSLSSSSSSPPIRVVHAWGGGLHTVPESFEIPAVSVRDAWHLWMHGDVNNNFPPFRLLQPGDMSHKNKRKRLSDLKYLMRKIQRKADDLGIDCRNLTPRSINSTFDLCRDSVKVPLKTARRRVRRYGQLVWLSVVDILRTQDKARSTMNLAVQDS
jgi:hypothetical protein